MHESVVVHSEGRDRTSQAPYGEVRRGHAHLQHASRARARAHSMCHRRAILPHPLPRPIVVPGPYLPLTCAQTQDVMFHQDMARAIEAAKKWEAALTGDEAEREAAPAEAEAVRQDMARAIEAAKKWEAALTGDEAERMAAPAEAEAVREGEGHGEVHGEEVKQQEKAERKDERMEEESEETSDEEPMEDVPQGEMERDIKYVRAELQVQFYGELRSQAKGNVARHKADFERVQADLKGANERLNRIKKQEDDAENEKEKAVFNVEQRWQEQAREAREAREERMEEGQAEPEETSDEEPMEDVPQGEMERDIKYVRAELQVQFYGELRSQAKGNVARHKADFERVQADLKGANERLNRIKKQEEDAKNENEKAEWNVEQRWQEQKRREAGEARPKRQRGT